MKNILTDMIIIMMHNVKVLVLAECISGTTKQTKHSNDDLSVDKKNIKITFIKTAKQKNLKSIFGCRLFTTIIVFVVEFKKGI